MKYTGHVVISLTREMSMQPPEQLQERMQAMAAAIKQEESLQVDALHRQRLMEKRLQEISKVRALYRPSYPHIKICADAENRSCAERRSSGIQKRERDL